MPSLYVSLYPLDSTFQSGGIVLARTTTNNSAISLSLDGLWVIRALNSPFLHPRIAAPPCRPLVSLTLSLTTSVWPISIESPLH